MKEISFEKVKGKDHGFTMDENHTHFILVDDGTDDKWQAEIQLRALLESELQKNSENKDNGTDSIKFYWPVSNFS